MTVMAGLLSRRDRGSLMDVLGEEIKSRISRRGDHAVEVYRDRRCMMAKVDIGAFGSPAFRKEPGGSVAMLVGQPLLGLTDSPDAGRAEDLAQLHRAWDGDSMDLCASANGVFCAAYYSPHRSTITLISDKLGIRPIYYWIDANFLVFATALRILEGLSIVPRRMDLRAITELKTLGVPLGKRTPYADISLLRAAEVLTVSSETTTSSHYWRWDGLGVTEDSEDRLLQEASDRFRSAVRRRRGKDRPAVAFLTGGLDSRCLVTELRHQGAELHTFNFARSGTQDRVFGRQFADRIGSSHYEIPIKTVGGNAKYAFTLVDALDRVNPLAEHPRLAWSGDGGSIGLGHVRVSEAVVDQLRRGEEHRAVATFQAEQNAFVPKWLFRGGLGDALEMVPQEGILAELQRIHTEDAGRAFHLFLMLNDQRRHLADHFEHIDLHGIEYLLPFFDSHFLELILSLPIDWCLRHQFYTKWLASFPDVVTSIPWQTYPGHQPCPLPVAEDLAYQWARNVKPLQTAEERRQE